MPEFRGEPMFEQQSQQRLQEPIHLQQRANPATEKTWQQPVTPKKAWPNVVPPMTVEEAIYGVKKDQFKDLDLGGSPEENKKVVQAWLERNKPDGSIKNIGLQEAMDKQALLGKVKGAFEEADEAKWVARNMAREYENKYLPSDRKLEWNSFMQRLDIVGREPKTGLPTMTYEEKFYLAKWVKVTKYFEGGEPTELRIKAGKFALLIGLKK